MSEAYIEARKRGDTQGQFRAAERAKRITHARLIEELRQAAIFSKNRAAAFRRALGIPKGLA